MEVAAAKDTGRALVRDFLLGLEPVLNSYVEHNITMAPGRAMDEDVCAESFRFQKRRLVRGVGQWVVFQSRSSWQFAWDNARKRRCGKVRS